MPVLFIGHGNPMNALLDTAFTRKLSELGRELPRPKAVLCISAHWMTEGTWITHMRHPKTIHDFYGFPQELFDVQYPAPGDPATAERISRDPSDPSIHPDNEIWGLDHGAWSVLRHMYPAADIPVLQLSLNIVQGPEFHFALGEKLKYLRHEGILIIGSGNIVHNLRRIDFADNARPFDWAIEFDAWVKQRLEDRDYNAIVHDARRSQAGKLSIPTPEHWYPILYALGAADNAEPLRFEHEGIENASISMRCLSVGAA
ncbi:MAG TPA: 4,5-DOPA dioxygenase extradiol [Bryobacteraceae bacterium]|nr:4,5-DOPA dioxygenase extradiol [Bryobacteraceae bacterium]